MRIKSCMREKQDERKENDEHQRKGDCGKGVSDWLSSFAHALVYGLY